MVWSEMREIDSAIKLGLRVFDKINRFRILKPAIQIKKKTNMIRDCSYPSRIHNISCSCPFSFSIGLELDTKTPCPTQSDHISSTNMCPTRV